MNGLVWHNVSMLPSLPFRDDAFHPYSVRQTEPTSAVRNRTVQCVLLLPSLCLTERKILFQVCWFGWILVVVFHVEKLMNDASCAVIVGGNDVIFTVVVDAVAVAVGAIVEG